LVFVPTKVGGARVRVPQDVLVLHEVAREDGIDDREVTVGLDVTDGHLGIPRELNLVLQPVFSLGEVLQGELKPLKSRELVLSFIDRVFNDWEFAQSS